MIRTVQDGGRSVGKSRVKLVCERLFPTDLTSEESPMLLDRQSRTRRCPRPEQLRSFIIKKVMRKRSTPADPGREDGPLAGRQSEEEQMEGSF